MILLIFLYFLFPVNDSLLTMEKEVKDFSDAVSLTLDGKENIYVLDAGSDQIIKFSNKLEYKKRNGKQGWAEGQFDSPTFIDGSTGLDLFISDGKNYRVQRLDLELNFISSLRTNLDDIPIDLRFRTPLASLVLNSNEFYVIDGDNNRIVVYKDGRNPSGVFGDYKSGKGLMLRPVKLLKDGKNFIYVLDKELKSVLRYDNLGNYVSQLSIKNLENFTIRKNILYLFDGKELVLYDLDKNSIIGKKIFFTKSQKNKFKDILVLNDNKYLLLGKNALSLWVEKN